MLLRRFSTLKIPRDAHAIQEFAQYIDIKGSNAIHHGDLIEVRRRGRILYGIVLKSSEKQSNSGDIRVLSPTGFVSVERTSDVAFQIPKWAHLPFIQQVDQSKGMKNNYIAKEASDLLTEAGIQSQALMHHFLRFLQSVEEYEISHKRVFSLLYDRLNEMSGTKKAVVGAKEQSVVRNFITVENVAKLMFGRDIPTPGQLLASHKYLLSNYRYFMPAVRTYVELRGSRTFEVRTPLQVGRLLWLENEIVALKRSGRNGTQLFNERIFPSSELNLLRAVPWTRNPPGKVLTSFLDKLEMIMDNRTADQWSWTDEELFIIECIKNAALSSSGFPCEYSRLVFSGIISPLSSLLELAKESDTKKGFFSYSAFQTGCNRLLSAINVWSKSTSRDFEMALKSLQVATMMDQQEQPVWVEEVFKELEEWSSEFLYPGQGPKRNLSKESILHSVQSKIVFPLKVNCNSSLEKGVFKQNADELDSIREECHSAVYVIDDPTAHELDDGISIEPVNESSLNSDDPSDCWVRIHIADPTAFIRYDHPIALLAQIRACSSYFADKHYPMMPDSLSDHIFNLKPKAPALTFSARINSQGEIIDYKVNPTVLKRVEKIHYSDVDQILDWTSILDYAKQDQVPVWSSQTVNAKAPERQHSWTRETTPMFDKSMFKPIPYSSEWISQHRSNLLKLQKIAQCHMQARIRNGGLFRDSPDSKIHVTPYGIERPEEMTINLDPYQGHSLSPSHQMVGELMVVAGRVAARFCLDHHLPVPFRGQVSFFDDAEELSKLHESSSSLLPSIIRHANLEEHNLAPIKSRIQSLIQNRDPKLGLIPHFGFQEFLPLMSAAILDLRPIGHFAMGIPGASLKSDRPSPSSMVGYIKATSPLRRYSDILVHWQIKAALLAKANPSQKVTPPYSAQDLKKLIPILHSREKISQISSRSNRTWALMWAGLREKSNTFVSIDRNLGAALSSPTNKIATTWMRSSMDNGIEYTCVVSRPKSSSDLFSKTRVMVVELGSIEGALVSDAVYYPGDVLKCTIQFIDTYRGILQLNPV